MEGTAVPGGFFEVYADHAFALGMGVGLTDVTMLPGNGGGGGGPGGDTFWASGFWASGFWASGFWA